jgi:hypothetical protein
MNMQKHIFVCGRYVYMHACMNVGTYVCIYIRMCASLAPERFDELYSYSVSMSLSVIDRYPVHTNISAAKIQDLEIGPKTKN